MHRDDMRCIRASGFALLEAIVALVLLAGAGLALFSWIQQNLQTATRIEQKQRETRMLRNAQSFIETVNPALRLDGSFVTDGLRVEWRSELMTPLQVNSSLVPGGQGTWLVGLYRLSVEVGDGAAPKALSFSVMRHGWKPGTEGRIQ